MDKLGCFVGQAIFTAIFMVVAALAGNVGAVYIALFCAGMFFMSISSIFMEDHNGIARIVIFCIGAALIIIPAFVLNIIVIVNKTGSFIELAYFLICAALVFTTWLTCGFFDGFWYMLNFVPVTAIALVSLLFNAITDSRRVLAIIYMVLGLIVLGVMLIMRLVNGSALDD